MPTQSEFQELIDNTAKEWTQVNDVNGYKFTGSNGNSIFIPASGYCNDGSVYNVGGSGLVWSSSLYTSYTDNAWFLYFNSNHCSILCGDSRCYGRAVRGVHM